MTGLTLLMIYAILTVAVWWALFMRAVKRRTLMRLASIYFQGSMFKDDWIAASRGFSTYLTDMRRLQILKNHLSTVPNDVSVSFRQYVLVSRIAYSLIFVLIGFAMLAYKFD